MAKFTAKGCHKVIAVRVDVPATPDDNFLKRYHYGIRSDGKLLTAFQCAIPYENQKPYWGGLSWSIKGTVKDMATFDLESWVRNRFKNRQDATFTVS